MIKTILLPKDKPLIFIIRITMRLLCKVEVDWNSVVLAERWIETTGFVEVRVLVFWFFNSGHSSEERSVTIVSFTGDHVWAGNFRTHWTSYNLLSDTLLFFFMFVDAAFLRIYWLWISTRPNHIFIDKLNWRWILCNLT